MINRYQYLAWKRPVLTPYWSSVQFSLSVMSDSVRPHGLQHTRLPCPSPTPRFNPNPCPLCWWCYPTISSSVVPFSSCPQSFLASRSFTMNQSVTASASASVLPMNIQGWFPLGLTDLISLQSEGLSRIFSSTKTPRQQFLDPQPFWLSSSHIRTWLLKKHSFNYRDLCQQSNVSAF